MPIKADKSLRAYYNEIDPYAAQWLRNLMAEGWITKGDVDERSIEDVRPNELAGYDRLHFFAGIAVWDFALNQVGWGRGEIWTGSCPCQPFSSAGAGAGFADERHLWPTFFHLIEECRPPIVFGEQVASKVAEPWIDLVQTDLETLDYRVAAVAFPTSSVGGPHIRDRLYWVGDSSCSGLEGHSGNGSQAGRTGTARPATSAGLHDSQPPPVGKVNGFWRNADWLRCRDGLWRAVEPGTQPLADRITSRVGRLRAYGNAINAEAAKAFIESYLDTF